MSKIILFFAGLFAANGVPHFVNGISGKDFHNPFLYRFVRWIPSPIFNTFWGLLSFFLGFMLVFVFSKVPPGEKFLFGFNWNTLVFCIGFITASIGLSIFFCKGGWN